MHIERINCSPDEKRPSPLTAGQLDEGLRSASTLVAGASLLFAKWARDFQKHSNALPRFDQETSNQAGGDPNIAYFHSHWRLAEDEALVIEATPPACESWNFQLNNYWMESLDYRYHTIHTNKLADYESDGSVRLVVAHEDPGLPVPSYARWLEEQDHTRTYEEFRTLLQVLHWQRPRRHSVLKTPHHMEYLDTVLEVFPRATIVQTHRDPLKSVPSFCSMVAHGRGMFSDRVEPGEIGSHWLAKTCRLVERTASAREAADPRRFVDISYYDLVSDPMAQLGKVYERAGIPFGPDAMQAAERTANRNVQHRYGRHVYDAGSFGLTRETIENRMAPYRHRHGIPYE